jgi:hypothetical protein
MNTITPAASAIAVDIGEYQGTRRAHAADQYEEYDERQDLTQRFWSCAPVGRMSGAVRFLRRTFRQPSGRSMRKIELRRILAD